MATELIIIVWVIAMAIIVILGETLRGIEKKEKEERMIYHNRGGFSLCDYETGREMMEESEHRYNEYFSPEQKTKRLRIKILLGLGMCFTAVVAFSVLIPLITG